MKYALLVYDSSTGWNELPSTDERELHDRAAYEGLDTGSVSLLAHYRLRPPQQTTTLRLANGKLTRTEGAAAETHATLRAFFLLESDDAETVLNLASELPAIRLGGSIEVWPLIEPAPHGSGGHHRSRWARRHRAA